jgi:hypothetical protein
MCFEMARFLEDHYKKGLIAKCKIQDCNKIILTWNGIEYCSPAHKSKFYDEKCMADEKKREDRRISNRLNKKYRRLLRALPSGTQKRYPSFKAYKEKHWPNQS